MNTELKKYIDDNAQAITGNSRFNAIDKLDAIAKQISLSLDVKQKEISQLKRLQKHALNERQKISAYYTKYVKDSVDYLSRSNSLVRTP